MASHGNVVIATSDDHFSQQINEAKACNKAVVIDFTATWCGPCKAIAPFFAQLSEQFSNVVFLKVDVDDLQSVTKDYSVEAMPTFIFLKDGNVVDKVVGANKPQLEAKVKQLASA